MATGVNAVHSDEVGLQIQTTKAKGCGDGSIRVQTKIVHVGLGSIEPLEVFCLVSICQLERVTVLDTPIGIDSRLSIHRQDAESVSLSTKLSVNSIDTAVAVDPL